MSEFAPWTLDALAWVATYTIHSTLMITAVALIVRYRKDISPTARDLLWKVALVGPLATASLHFGLGVGGLGGSYALSETPATTAPVAAAAVAAAPPAFLLPDAPPPPPPSSQVIISDSGSVVVFSTSSSPRPAPPVMATAAMTTAAAAPIVPTPTPSAPLGALTPDLAALLLGLLGAGSALSLGLFARRVRDLKRHLKDRRATVEDPALELFIELTADTPGGKAMRLSTTDAIASPVALVGREICVPTRVLDEGALPPAELQAMLAHEIAHLVRRDPEWLTASAVLESVFFFQPLLRMVRQRMVDNSELLCDAWARERTGDGLALAKCIERVAGWMKSPHLSLASAMARPQSPIVDRIRRLVMPADRRRLSGHQRVGLGLAILGALAWLAPSVSAARNNTLPSVDDVEETAELCPYGSADEGCDSWHRTLVGDPVDDGRSSMVFNSYSNAMAPFAVSALTASSDLSRRELRRERRRAERDAREAERRQARIDRERRQLAAEIREADDEARRASERARRLEARARRLEAPRPVPPAHSDRLHVEVKRAGAREGCTERQVPPTPRHVLRIDNHRDAPMVVEFDVDGVDGLGDLNFGLDLDLDLDLGGLMASPPQKSQAEMMLGDELLGEIAKSGLLGKDDLKEIKQEFAEAKREIAEAKRELLDRDLAGLSEPMRQQIERELAKAEREMAKVERELSRELRESGLLDAGQRQSKAQKSRHKAQLKAQKAQLKAQLKAQQKAQKTQHKARHKAEKRAKKRAQERENARHGV